MTKYEPILAVIRKHESRGDYDIVWAGMAQGLKPAHKITTMTIAEVRAWQDSAVKGGAKSSAAGAYQIIRKTLSGLMAVQGLGLGYSDKFDKANQDALAVQLLRQRGIDRYLAGTLSENDMIMSLAKEWASLPRPDNGRSYYAGDGLNKAHATVDEVRAALRACKNYAPAPEAKPSPATANSGGGWLASLLAALSGVRK